MADPFNLQRFVSAQEPVMDEVRMELRSGRKQSHWMWFVFPQIKGLGHSSTAVHYALSCAAEARAYLEHPVLGDNLYGCCELLLALGERSPEAVLGMIDALKLRSSMTLFAAVADDDIFQRVLDKYYGGAADPATLAILGES